MKLRAALVASLFFLGAGTAVEAASGSLAFKAAKLPPANAGVPYGPNGQGFSFCQPAPTQVSDLCPPGIGVTPKSPKGGNPPYHFVLGGGFPPFGITLDLNGRLHGTPNIADNGPTTFTVCAVDLSANSVCVPVTINVFNLDGNYTGSFKGSASVIDPLGNPHKSSVSGAVDASISGSTITVTEPGSGTGTVTPFGVADFGSSGGVGVLSANCSFAGTFVTSKVGAVKAGGTFNCVIDDGAGTTGEATGTWSARKLL
jgi:hypothetical protein